MRRSVAACIATLVALLLLVRPALSQDIEVLLPEKECKVKYAFLYSFGLMTAWPAEAFAAPEAPFVIGVLGEERFPKYLDLLAAKKQIQGRSIAVRRYKQTEEIKDCHLLYVTGAFTAEHEQTVARQIAGRSVLVVGEGPPSGPLGLSTIHFVIENQSVKFRVNLPAAKASRLNIDPRLLTLAKQPPAAQP